MLEIEVKRLSDTAVIPTRAHEADAGFDVYADEDVEVELYSQLVSTGIAVSIPQGYYGRLKGRSGLSAKTAIRVEEGTIDAGYTGEIKVNVYYQGDLALFDEPFGDVRAAGLAQIKKGDRTAQLIIQPLPLAVMKEVDELAPTPRGGNGFGSTGV